MSRVLNELKETLMGSLEDLDTVKVGKLRIGELEAIKMITSSLDHIENICEDDKEGEYSSRGRRRDSMGRYSRDGYSQDGRNGYSRDGGREEMMEHLDYMMEAAPDERSRERIRQFKREMKNA